MYHHQPSYNPYAAPDPPQYAPQYGSWPELPQQEMPVSPDTFSSSFRRQSPSDQYPPYPQYQQPYPPYVPQSQPYSPQPPSPPPTTHWRRRTSVQQRWDDYIASEECSENLQAGDRTYINQVTTELEQRAAADERISALTQQQHAGVVLDPQHAQQAERDRRLKWAQDMIIQSPALCAEVYFAMARRPPCNNSPAASGSSNTAAAAMPPPPPPPPPMAASRSNSSSSINSCAGDSSYSASPT